MARIDHGAAAKAGIAMAPMQLLIFGNGASGSLFMIASPATGMDLPLKGLAWQDSEGTIWLFYNNPVYLAKRHEIPFQLLKQIEGIRRICEEAVTNSPA